MITNDISNLKDIDRIEILCDNCGSTISRTIKNIKKRRKKWDNRDICQSCSCILTIDKKPQCSKSYWISEDVKNKHSLSIKNSNDYKVGISNRPDNSGEKNPMFGRTHSSETIGKMSISRRGKLGDKSTAWKGGKTSITRRVKGFQNRNGWYKRIYERDGFKCVYCGSKKQIEAHHKNPIKNIIDKYKHLFTNDNDFYTYLILLDVIIDNNLDNGVTLCRECHRKEHINFGSHYPNRK